MNKFKEASLGIAIKFFLYFSLKTEHNKLSGTEYLKELSTFSYLIWAPKLALEKIASL
jgi:hypothetical protein